MARPPLPIGSWGRDLHLGRRRPTTRASPSSYKSQARFRDHDGHVRPVSAYGKTKTAAERALLKKLQDRAKTGQSGELTAMHKITHLLDLWEEKFKEQIADGRRSPPPWTPTSAPSRTTYDPPSAPMRSSSSAST